MLRVTADNVIVVPPFECAWVSGCQLLDQTGCLCFGVKGAAPAWLQLRSARSALGDGALRIVFLGRQRHLHHSVPGVGETPASSTLVEYFSVWHSFNICFLPCIRVSRNPPEGRFHACNPVQAGIL